MRWWWCAGSGPAICTVSCSPLIAVGLLGPAGYLPGRGCAFPFQLAHESFSYMHLRSASMSSAAQRRGQNVMHNACALLCVSKGAFWNVTYGHVLCVRASCLRSASMSSRDSPTKDDDATANTITDRPRQTLNAFQTSSWYSSFKPVSCPTEIIPLPLAVVEYLEADGVWTHDVPDAVSIKRKATIV